MISGHGVRATVNGKSALLGNPKLMKDEKIDIGGLGKKAEELSRDGKTPMFIAIDRVTAGIVAVADTLKENSKEAIERLHKLELEVVMITGDNRKAAEAIAEQVGIDRVLAEVLPEAKAKAVKELQDEVKL